VRARRARPWQRVLELVQAHRKLAASAAALLLAASVGLLAPGWRSDEDLQAQRIRATAAVLVPWLDGDPKGARAALAAYLELEDSPPFAVFLGALAEDDLTRSSSDPAERALLEGERARRAGRAREALARFKTAWDLSPGFPMIVLLQGLAAFEAGELQAARRALEVSAHAFGPSRELHRTLATLYDELGLHLDALRALSAVVATAPGDAEAWLALARAQAHGGDEGAALEAALRAHALDGSMRAELEELASAWERAGSVRLAAGLRTGLER